MAEHEGIWSEYRPTYWDGWSAVKRVGDLVRCRNCKHYEPNTYSHFTCELLTFHVEPDGFCAWGVRREDE